MFLIRIPPIRGCGGSSSAAAECAGDLATERMSGGGGRLAGASSGFWCADKDAAVLRLRSRLRLAAVVC